MASHPIYQFYAELNDYEPTIWRRFQVSNHITVARLGYILMTMFEMEASHLFSFHVPTEDNFQATLQEKYPETNVIELFKSPKASKRVKDQHYEIITEFTHEFSDESNIILCDAIQNKIKNVVSQPKERMVFTYDYGDDWRVSVVLEKIFVDKELPGKELPRVLEGEGFGIIEDCGGIWGLEEIAKAFQQKKGNEYEHFSGWLGITDLDLESFDIDDINFRLKKLPRIYADIYEHRKTPSKKSMDFIERRY